MNVFLTWDFIDGLVKEAIEQGVPGPFTIKCTKAVRQTLRGPKPKHLLGKVIFKFTDANARSRG